MSQSEQQISKKETALWIYWVILIIAVFIQYGKTLSYGFVWDDKIVIEENPRIKKGMQSIPDLFLKFKSPYRHDQYGYRPITLVTFALEIEFFGVRPYYHHLMNLIYYALLCLVLLIFVSRLFQHYIRLFAFFVVLVYVVHPLHVEVVANIKSRDELLAVLFGTLSLISYLSFLRSAKWRYMLTTVLFYLLSFFSKENAVTLTLIYPLIYFYENKESPFANIRRLITSNIHVIVLLILSVLVFALSESSELGKNLVVEQNIVREDDILGNSLFHTDSLFAKLPTVLVILIMYLKLFVAPWPMVFYYGYNQVPLRSWLDPVVWMSIAIIAGLVYLVYRYRKHYPELWFGGLMFLASLSIYLHIIRKLSDTMADRFMFLPSLGLCIFLVGLIGMFTRLTWLRADAKKKSNQVKRKLSTPVLIFSSIAIILVFLSNKRADVWESDEKLIFTDMNNLPNVSRVHYYYANILWTQIKNNPSKRVHLEKDMIDHYKRSIEIAPQYVYYSRMELATYYSSIGMYQMSYDEFARIDSLFPDRGPVLLNLAQCLINLNRYDESIPILIRTRELAPYYSSVPYLLALAYDKIGEFDKALAMIDEGIKLFPDEKRIFLDALSIIYGDMKNEELFVQTTLSLLNYGGNASVVYSRIIRQYNFWGMKDKAAYYSAEAKRKSIPVNP